MYTFQFQLTEEEYFEYSLCHSYSMPKFRKRHMTQRFLYPLLFVVCAFFLWVAYANPLTAYIPFGIVTVCWIVFYRKLNEWGIRRSIKTIKESGKAPYDDDFKAVFEEEKLLTSTKDTEVTTAYSALEKIVIGKNALYLYKNAIAAYIMPYRVFASEEEKESFLQFLRQKTNAPVIAGVTK